MIVATQDDQEIKIVLVDARVFIFLVPTNQKPSRAGFIDCESLTRFLMRGSDFKAFAFFTHL